MTIIKKKPAAGIWHKTNFEKFLDIFYPEQCCSCQASLSFSPVRFLCPECLKKIRYSNLQNSCPRCASPLGLYTRENNDCVNCRSRSLGFTKALSFCSYEGPARDLIHQLKFANNRKAARPLGQALAERAAEIPADALSCIIPVPLHKKRLQERGYNQSEEIAAGFAEHTGGKIVDDCLIKTRHTPPQAELNREERLNTPEGAFTACNHNSLKSCVLIDDVITTGATASCCAIELRKAGFKRIYAVCAAR
ncbi:MAG: ComF family protein [Planctomycetota bacterium]|jgi:ComF family protein